MKNKLTSFKEKYFPHLPFSLLLSIILLIVILIVLSNLTKLNDSGILINFATELMGILVTILIIDYFFRKYEKEKWSSYESLFRSNLNGYLTFIVVEFKHRFELPIELNTDKKVISNLLPYMEQIITSVQNKGLREIEEIFNDSSENLDNLISLAKINPDPSCIVQLLSIRENASFFIIAHRHNDDKRFSEFRSTIDESIIHSVRKTIGNLLFLEKYISEEE